jgi:hypothetical protein
MAMNWGQSKKSRPLCIQIEFFGHNRAPVVNQQAHLLLNLTINICQGMFNTLHPDALAPASAATESFAPPSESWLPNAPLPFIGRDRELTTIQRLIQQGIPIIELTDAEGKSATGKSAIALQIAQTLKVTNADCQLYANLQGTDSLPKDSNNVLQDWLVDRWGHDPLALPQSRSSLHKLWVHQIQSQKGLIVLDNVASFKQIEALMPPRSMMESGQWVVLITSRQSVLPEDLGKTIFIDHLNLATATALLQSIVNPAKDGSTLASVELDERVSEQLIKLSIGSPLVVRLLGGALSHLEPTASPEQLMLQIQKFRLKLITAKKPEAEARVLGCINAAYQSLNAEQRNLLSRLSVLRGDDFSVALASHLCGSKSAAATPQIFQHLVDRQWISPLDADRFTLNETIRSFLWDKVTPQARATLIMWALEWPGFCGH